MQPHWRNLMSLRSCVMINYEEHMINSISQNGHRCMYSKNICIRRPSFCLPLSYTYLHILCTSIYIITYNTMFGGTFEATVWRRDDHEPLSSINGMYAFFAWRVEIDNRENVKVQSLTVFSQVSLVYLTSNSVIFSVGV